MNKLEKIIEAWQQLADALAALVKWAEDRPDLYADIATHPASIDIIATMTDTTISLYNQALYITHDHERTSVLLVDKHYKPETDANIRTNIQAALDALHNKQSILKRAIENTERFNSAENAIMVLRAQHAEALGPLDNDTFRLLHQQWPALFGLLTSF
jgi:hypothetical protein